MKQINSMMLCTLIIGESIFVPVIILRKGKLALLKNQPILLIYCRKRLTTTVIMYTSILTLLMLCIINPSWHQQRVEKRAFLHVMIDPRPGILRLFLH